MLTAACKIVKRHAAVTHYIVTVCSNYTESTMAFVLVVDFHCEVIVRRLWQTVLFVKNVKNSQRFHLNQICNMHTVSHMYESDTETEKQHTNRWLVCID